MILHTLFAVFLLGAVQVQGQVSVAACNECCDQVNNEFLPVAFSAFCKFGCSKECTYNEPRFGDNQVACDAGWDFSRNGFFIFEGHQDTDSRRVLTTETPGTVYYYCEENEFGQGILIDEEPAVEIRQCESCCSNVIQYLDDDTAFDRNRCSEFGCLNLCLPNAFQGDDAVNCAVGENFLLAGSASIDGKDFVCDAQGVHLSSSQEVPTGFPTLFPSANPTVSPSDSPTSNPSKGPTGSPTTTPTLAPSPLPSVSPTDSPTVTPTLAPSLFPSVSPTAIPTLVPTPLPSVSPTVTPTLAPSNIPSVSPTAAPTLSPFRLPTLSPSVFPSQSPTFSPTMMVTSNPSGSPTMKPSAIPSYGPTSAPIRMPTFSPTETGTGDTFIPTYSPTYAPTNEPTYKPSYSPTEAEHLINETLAPSTDPTEAPTLSPTSSPPVLSPTSATTNAPTSNPTVNPTTEIDPPSAVPTGTPTVFRTLSPSITNDTSTTEESESPTAAPTSSENVNVTGSSARNGQSNPGNTPSNAAIIGSTVSLLIAAVVVGLLIARARSKKRTTLNDKGISEAETNEQSESPLDEEVAQA
mmetsp:Transcript_12139/g.15730  ORF Transcript_12139/g.15730 Transcript_12139/m.15730 type:complete len:578 (-) Transcript_12139:172-1905(-)